MLSRARGGHLVAPFVCLGFGQIKYADDADRTRIGRIVRIRWIPKEVFGCGVQGLHFGDHREHRRHRVFIYDIVLTGFGLPLIWEYHILLPS